MSNTSWMLREIHGKVWDHEIRLSKIEDRPSEARKNKPLWTESRSTALAGMMIVALILVNVLSVEKIKALQGLFMVMKDLK